MANLTRYGERENKFGISQLLQCDDGEYVKFADIKELLQTLPNSDYAAALNMALVEFDGQVLDSWTRARIRDIVLRLAQPAPGTP